MTVSDQVNGEWVHNCDRYASTEAVRHINIMAPGSQWFGLDISATGAVSGQGSFVAMPGMQQKPTSAASTEPVSTVAAAPTSTTNLLIPSSTDSTSVAIPADGPLVAAGNEVEPTNTNGNTPWKGCNNRHDCWRSHRWCIRHRSSLYCVVVHSLPLAHLIWKAKDLSWWPAP